MRSNRTFREIALTAVAVLLAAGVATGASAEERKSYPTPKGHPLDKVISGFEFRTKETQAIQLDDFQNPGFLLVDQGEELWSKAEGSAGKACMDCHNDAADSMKTVGATYPKWNDKVGKPVNVEQRINLCRTENMGAEEWKYESGQMLAMTTFVKSQSRGMPVNVDFSAGEMKKWQEKGDEIYHTRFGQLDMSCAHCHEDNWGNQIRSDLLSQGHSNGFPTYRLKWQGVGTLHRRFKGCMDQIRAEPFKRGSDEFIAIETYLAWRGIGLPVETPAVRQ